MGQSLIVMSLAILTWWANPLGAPAARLEIGLVVGVLSALPMIYSLEMLRSRRERGYLVFEFHLIFCGFLFGISEIVPSRSPLHDFSGSDLRIAGLLVCLYISTAAFLHRLLVRRVRARGCSSIEVFPIVSTGVSTAIAISYPLALIAQVGLAQVSTVGSFAFFVELTLRVVLAMIVFSPRQEARTRVIAGAGLLAFAGHTLASGLLAPIAMTAALGLCGRIAVSGRVVRRSAVSRLGQPLLAAVGLGALVVFAAAAQMAKDDFRREFWTEGRSASALERTERQVELIEDVLLDVNSGAGLEAGLQSLALRFQTLPVFAHAVNKTPSAIPFQDGGTYAALLYVMIPRVFWPSKPTFTLGNWWGRTWGLLNSRNYSTSINLHVAIEGYLNFGWQGVLLAAAVVALVCALWERVFLNSSKDAFTRAGLIALMHPFAWPESDLGLSLGLIATWSVFYVISMPVLVRLLPRSRQSTPSTTSPIGGTS